jgi:hypothetical protein
MYLVKKIYLLAILLTLGQVVGGVIADISIIIAFCFSFLYFCFSREVDIVLIFLMLTPSIVLRNIPPENGTFLFFGKSNYHDYTWLQIALPKLKDVFIVGPFALSAKLGFALAVPIRLICFFNKTRYPNSLILWFLVLIISIGGLWLSVYKGIKSESGITVGLRIALSLGTLFLPSCISDMAKFNKSLLRILMISIILFILGLLTEHWLFVVSGLLPFIFLYSHRIFVKLLVIISSIILLVMDFTFTFKGIVVLSIFFYILIEWKLFISIFKLRIIKYFILIIPILLTLMIVFSDQFLEYNGDGKFKRELSEKINSDRKILWQASFAQISTSFPLIVAGGRPIPVQNFQGHNTWDPGAHNIYLEISRQLGVLTFFIVLFSVLNVMMNVWSVIEGKKELILFSGLLSVYLVFGFTGNSIIYDGVGFLFWFVVGQYCRLKGV